MDTLRKKKAMDRLRLYYEGDISYMQNIEKAKELLNEAIEILNESNLTKNNANSLNFIQMMLEKIESVDIMV